jgi:hypothetical protein
MQPVLQPRFAELEVLKQAHLAATATWSEAQLQFRPAGQWCALDVLDHIVRTEAAILRAMQAQQQQNQRPVDPADRLRSLLLVWLFRTPARVKAPGPVNAILPGAALDRDKLANQWSETRRNLREFLDDLRPGQLHFAAFQHPVSGWMTVPRTLEFLASHIHHHRYQLRRLQTARQRRRA